MGMKNYDSNFDEWEYEHIYFVFERNAIIKVIFFANEIYLMSRLTLILVLHLYLYIGVALQVVVLRCVRMVQYGTRYTIRWWC